MPDSRGTFFMPGPALWMPRASAVVLSMAMAMSGAFATETGKSLYEQRQGIFKGTSQGILLFGSGNTAAPAQPKDAKAATPSPVTATTPAGAGANPAQAQGTGEPQRAAVFSTPSFGQLAPPSGIPLNAVRHREGPERGVALPVARPASSSKP